MSTYCNIDMLAESLIDMGSFAKKLPPSWNGGRVCIPVCGANGQYVGKMLPGTGLLLSMDAKELGITKPMPNVLSRTPVMKMVDFLKSERRGVAAAAMLGAAMLIPNQILRTIMAPTAMALTTYDGIINARATGKTQDVVIVRPGIATASNNLWCSYWQSSGGTYAPAPSGSVHVNSTSGSWSVGLKNPTNGDKCYILTFGYAPSITCSSMMLHDLLVAVGNLDFTSTSAQTVTSTPLTRYTSGVGVMMAYDTIGSPAATSSNLSSSYTNQSGTAGQAIVASPQTTISAQTLIPTQQLGCALAAGDYGVRSVQTVTLSVSKTSGTFALNLFFPLAFIPAFIANLYSESYAINQLSGVTELAQSSGAVLGCLNVYALGIGTALPQVTAFMRTVQG